MEDNNENVINETETKNEEENDEAIKINQQLLEANAQIASLQKQIEAKEAELKEKSFNDLLTKYKIKPEFHEFVKMKLQWREITDLDKALTDFVKENPALIETITTGGTTQEIVTNNQEPETSENPLLKYKEENKL